MGDRDSAQVDMLMPRGPFGDVVVEHRPCQSEHEGSGQQQRESPEYVPGPHQMVATLAEVNCFGSCSVHSSSVREGFRRLVYPMALSDALL